jgi:alpha-ribazole phosphatase
VSAGRDKVWAPLLGAEAQAGAMTEVLLARHPQVEANLSGVFVGSGESPYTELGARQATALAASIAAWAPSSVHASPRTRARMVGEDAARIAGVELHIDDGLAEIDFGAAEGLTYDEAKLRGVEIDLLGGPPETAPFKDGETWHAFAYRVGEAARRVETAGPRIAVVAHGGVIRSLLTYWLRLDHRAAWRFAVGNATISTLTLADGHGTLRTFGVEAGGCGWEGIVHPKTGL